MAKREIEIFEPAIAISLVLAALAAHAFGWLGQYGVGVLGGAVALVAREGIAAFHRWRERTRERDALVAALLAEVTVIRRHFGDLCETLEKTLAERTLPQRYSADVRPIVYPALASSLGQLKPLSLVTSVIRFYGEIERIESFGRAMPPMPEAMIREGDDGAKRVSFPDAALHSYYFPRFLRLVVDAYALAIGLEDALAETLPLKLRPTSRPAELRARERQLIEGLRATLAWRGA